MSHWYDSEGNPRHHEGKDGKDTTLREARKLGLFPSVTTIGQVVAKFALTNWLQEEAAMMAARMVVEEATPGELTVHINDREWAKKVIKATSEATMKKADEGTDIHDVLEKFFSGKMVAEEHLPMCDAVDTLITEKTGCSEWKTETRFCNTELGFAGMCDLHNEEWIIDFKTKDSVNKSTRGWPEQAEQLAAYRRGLLGASSTARLANVFISREDPTQVIWFEHKDDMAWKRFRHTLMLWQVTKKYGPYYESIK